MNKEITKSIAFITLGLAASASGTSATAADLKAGQLAFEANGCGNCHELSQRTVGPSLKEIARRYKGKQVTAELAERIRIGSEGRWGGPPHPSYEALEATDALLITTWIMAGAPK